MWRSSWKSGSSAPRMPVFLRGRRGDAVPTLTSTVSPSKTCLTTCTCPVARAAETNCAMSGSPAGMSAGVLSIDTSLRIYGGDFDLVKSTSSGRPIPRPRQYGLVRCPGSAGALAGMGQWCGWWAGADLWSAGIPARTGGVVGICDVDGAFIGRPPTPYACLPSRRERGVIPCPPDVLHSTRWR